MSELVVGSIKGLSANSFEIDIATGSTLDLTNAKAGSIPKAAFPAGSILQVVQAVKTDVFSTTSGSYTDITGLSVTITPRSATSKFLITAYVNVGAQRSAHLRLAGGNSSNFVGDAASNQVRSTYSTGKGQVNWDVGIAGLATTITLLDSPATTSQITYKVQMVVPELTGFVNRSGQDSNDTATGRPASSLTVMEVAG